MCKSHADSSRGPASANGEVGFSPPINAEKLRLPPTGPQIDLREWPKGDWSITIVNIEFVPKRTRRLEAALLVVELLVLVIGVYGLFLNRH